MARRRAPKRLFRRSPGLLASAGVAVCLLAACGGEDTTGREGANVARGEELFVSGCGGCHTLADAGTSAQIGPNLDHAFGYSREQGFDESTFFEITLRQIDLAAPPMPADIYEGQEAVDVAAYVADVAGAEDALEAGGQPGGGEAAGGGGEAGGGEAGGETATADDETEDAETEETETDEAETEETETEVEETEGETETAEEAGGAVEEGRQVFASAGCVSCHTLADAGASGTIGPNLDDSMPPRELVVERVTNGMGVMPSFADQLSEEQIQAVADYVSSVAGQ